MQALTGRLQREGAMAVVFISQNSLVAIGYERVAKDAIRLPGITWVGRLRWEAKKEAAIEELTQHLETNEKLTRFWRKEGAVALVVSLPHGGPCAFTRAAQGTRFVFSLSFWLALFPLRKTIFEGSFFQSLTVTHLAPNETALFFLFCR